MHHFFKINYLDMIVTYDFSPDSVLFKPSFGIEKINS